ncbi:MAG: DUF2637 domain-containing protein [Actinoallomurus sp.]
MDCRSTVVSVALLAGIAAVVSFGDIRELALRHGEPQWSAALIPLSVDGMVVAASMSVLLQAGWAGGVNGCPGRFSLSGALPVSLRPSRPRVRMW